MDQANPQTPGSVKRCPRCGETKPKTGFYKRRGSPSGITTYCKICTKVIQRGYRIQRRADDKEHAKNLAVAKVTAVLASGGKPEDVVEALGLTPV